MDATNRGSSLPDLSLYFHLPFCDTLCYFCGCNMILTRNRERIKRYVRYLKKEIDLLIKAHDQQLIALFDTYWQGMDEKLLLLEKIKFQAALVRNGIHYLPIIAEELREKEPRLYEDILVLINQHYTYHLFSADSQFSDVKLYLQQVKQQHLSFKSSTCLSGRFNLTSTESQKEVLKGICQNW